jgi:hypothetical protein
VRDFCRRRDVGAERRIERVDQRLISQCAGDVVGGDDAQGDFSEM